MFEFFVSLLTPLLALCLAVSVYRIFKLQDGVAKLFAECDCLSAECDALKASQRRPEGNVGMLCRRLHELIAERDALKAELAEKGDQIADSNVSQRRLLGLTSENADLKMEILKKDEQIAADRKKLAQMEGIAAIVAPKRGPDGRFEKRQKAPLAA